MEAPRARRRRPRVSVSSIRARGAVVFGSVLAHMLAFIYVHDRPRPPPAPPAVDVTLDLDAPREGDPGAGSGAGHDARGAVVQPAGGAGAAFVDGDRKGAGGAEAGGQAVHLADRAETQTFVPAPTNRLDRDQVQRLRTADRRQSFEDRRATPNPLDATFVASGGGVVEDRRTRAPDPSRGSSADRRTAEERGGDPGAGGEAVLTGALGEGGPRELTVTLPAAGHLLDGPARDDRADAHGGALRAPGLGVVTGAAGEDHRASATPRDARPDVAEGYAAVPAANVGKTSDTVDSRQEAAARMKSLVQASTFGARVDGEGGGGAGGGGDPGAGGAAGAGAQGGPAGDGFGPLLDYNSRDPRLVSWFTRLHRKIDPLWRDAFPREELLDLKQGLVILDFTVRKDGTLVVQWPPVRRSGIDAFDANVAAALRKASPVDPPPAVLGRDEVRIRAPFRVDNAAIK